MCYSLWYNAPTMLPTTGRQHRGNYGNNRLKSPLRFSTRHASLRRPIVAPDVCSLKVEEGGTNEGLPSIVMKCTTVFVETHSKHQRRQKIVFAKDTDVQSNIPIKKMANLSPFFQI